MEENQQTVNADTTAHSPNGASRTTALSSNATLFWRVFVPAFGTVFFLGLAMAHLFTNAEELYSWAPAYAMRIFFTLILVGWVYFVRRTIWKLKRIDANDAHIYVTNYWVTARYPWSDVDRVEETRRMGRRVAHLHLKGAGRFGRKISFLPGTHFRQWMDEKGKSALLISES